MLDFVLGALQALVRAKCQSEYKVTVGICVSIFCFQIYGVITIVTNRYGLLQGQLLLGGLGRAATLGLRAGGAGVICFAFGATVTIG